MARPMRPILDRILDRVTEDDNGCWVFGGPVSSSGYGVVGKGGRHAGLVRTHRYMYEYHRADIPEGLVVDHLCRNKRCCNPWHLEPVDMRTNYMRGIRKTHITECKHGHPFSPENTRQTPRQRVCITCERRRGQVYRDKEGAA